MTTPLMQLYRDHGLKLLPIPVGRKSPVLKGWQVPADRTIDAGSNVGILVGSPSMVADIDLDTTEAVQVAEFYLAEEYLTEFTVAAFGRPGKRVGHLFIRQESCKPFKVVDPATREVLLELRGDGQQTIVPPSVHPSGETLAWSTQFPLDRLWTEPVKGLMAERVAAMVAVPLLVAPYWTTGARNDLALSLTGYLLKAGWTAHQTAGVIAAVCRLTNDPEEGSRLKAVAATAVRLVEDQAVLGYKGLEDLVPPATLTLLQRLVDLSAEEATTIAQWTAYAQQPHDTDMGNAKRLWAALKDRVRYVPHFDKWYTWQETYWQEDNGYTLSAMAKQVVLDMYGELSGMADDNRRKQFAKWIAASESRARIDAMVELLKSEPGIVVTPDQLDQHPMLLPVINGVIDLTTGYLHVGRPEDLLTKRVPVEYDPAATCPLWEAFLLRIMDGSQEMVDYLQRLIGHALTGDVGGKYFVFLHGPKGDNGKSTLVETILRMLGEYGIKSPTTMISLRRHGDGIPNDVARLRGIRFTVTNEVNEGVKLSEATVKDLTGSDTLAARFMHQNYFDFKPTHKLWVYGNYRPLISGTDNGMWDRVKTIEFDVVIPKEEQDPNFQEKLALELPGILAWAVRGELARRQVGLRAPDKVDKATRAYRSESDMVRLWLTEQCQTGPDLKETQKALYADYLQWCRETNTTPLGRNNFGERLTQMGFESRVGGQKRTTRHGLALAVPTEEDNFEIGFFGNGGGLARPGQPAD